MKKLDILLHSIVNILVDEKVEKKRIAEVPNILFLCLGLQNLETHIYHLSHLNSLQPISINFLGFGLVFI